MIAMSEEQVYECLSDAGCGKELIKQFEACQHSGSQKDQMRLLADYRRLLLERIHTEQKKLDLLDYLGMGGRLGREGTWVIPMADSC